MANWKTQVGQLGMGAVVTGLKAVRGRVSKGDYKRMLATAIAQLLALHPDLGSRKARRRARKVTGAKPAKKILVKPSRSGARRTAEATAVAAATAGALKVVGAIGKKVAAKVDDALDSKRASPNAARPRRPSNASPTADTADA
ncbi:MAG: hypothetical protein H0T86_15575 [Gemmatimonadales bacterium]|nr:hypothetical protein [Gemmatimonadales bacterium]